MLSINVPPNRKRFSMFVAFQYKDDCLVININVPLSVDFNKVITSQSNLHPVLVWIHGGAFFIGSGTAVDLDGRFLSNSSNSLVVSFNYRLGFLSVIIDSVYISVKSGFCMTTVVKNYEKTRTSGLT